MNRYTLLFICLIGLFACKEDDATVREVETNEYLYYCSKSIPNGSWQVYKKDLRSNKVNQITNQINYNYWWIDISPNKQELLLLRSPKSSPTDQFDYENAELIKSKADGSDSEVLIGDNEFGWFAFGNPHWSPSGEKIMLIAQPTNSTSPFYTYLVDLNGKNPLKIINQYSIDANWNKKGDQITFVGIDSTGFVDATSFEVFTASYDASTNVVSSIHQITSDNTRNHDPCFSPDGTQIVFSASNAQLTDANLVTINLSNKVRNSILDDNGIHGGPITWEDNDQIYHHGIYIGLTNFTVDAFSIQEGTNQSILKETNSAFISPHYLVK